MQNHNILFLDDDPHRTKRFRREVPSAHTVETVEDCVSALQSKEWDFVFLDHDLGGKQFVSSDEPDTGMEVVRWLLTNNRKISKIVVHSHNYEAAEEMVAKLSGANYSASYTPFLYLTSEKIEEILNGKSP